jgi:hypothetical protein
MNAHIQIGRPTLVRGAVRAVLDPGHHDNQITGGERRLLAGRSKHHSPLQHDQDLRAGMCVSVPGCPFKARLDLGEELKPVVRQGE